MLLTLLESTATTAKQPSGLFWVIFDNHGRLLSDL